MPLGYFFLTIPLVNHGQSPSTNNISGRQNVLHIKRTCNAEKGIPIAVCRLDRSRRVYNKLPPFLLRSLQISENDVIPSCQAYFIAERTNDIKSLLRKSIAQMNYMLWMT